MLFQEAFVSLLIIILCSKKTQQYEMDPITRSPINDTTPSVWDILREFESRRSPTLQVLVARLSLGDAVDLCEALQNDDTTMKEMADKKLYYYIPVTPKSGNKDDLPSFINSCYGWKRRPCIGIPKPPFDYRCSYWTPYLHIAEEHCGNGVIPIPRSNRRRFDSLTLSGLEAVSLCASDNSLVLGYGTVILNTVALPTNEATDLRCINWALSPEGGWIKEVLEREACDLMNFKRPGSYVDNEIKVTPEGEFVQDVYSNVVKCESRGRRTDCMFQ